MSLAHMIAGGIIAGVGWLAGDVPGMLSAVGAYMVGISMGRVEERHSGVKE